MSDKEIEITQKEMFFQKQVLNPYPTGSQSYAAYEKGFVECFNVFFATSQPPAHLDIDHVLSDPPPGHENIPFDPNILKQMEGHEQRADKSWEDIEKRISQPAAVNLKELTQDELRVMNKTSERLFQRDKPPAVKGAGFILATEQLPEPFKVVVCKYTPDSPDPRKDTELHWGFVTNKGNWDRGWQNHQVEWLDESPTAAVDGKDKQYDELYRLVYSNLAKLRARTQYADRLVAKHSEIRAIIEDVTKQMQAMPQPDNSDFKPFLVQSDAGDGEARETIENILYATGKFYQEQCTELADVILKEVKGAGDGKEDAVAFMNWTLSSECDTYNCTDEDEWTNIYTKQTLTTAQLYDIFKQQNK